MTSSTRLTKAASRKSSIALRHTADGSNTYIQTITKQRTQTELNEFKREIDIDDHYISLEQLYSRYQTDPNRGLTRAKAVELLHVNGPNCLVASNTKSKWVILLEQLFGGFSLIVWVGACLSFVAYGIEASTGKGAALDEVYLGVVLLLTILFQGLFGFYQESVTTAIMESFGKMIPSYAVVVRDGQRFTLPTEELVVGDLVEVKQGDLIPADIRILQSKGMKVDNSSITGESEHQNRSPICTDKHALETANLAFYGTSVVEGYGTGIVIACGDDTLIGHIAGLTSGLKKETTPMKKETNFFVKIISLVALLQGVFFLVLMLALGHDIFESITHCIAIVVGNIPLELLVTLTACLTLTAKRMQKKQCLVKNLHAIETLGSTTVICSDKTGTLTQNKMTVVHLYYDEQVVPVTDNFKKIQITTGFNALAKVAMLCNRAEFLTNQDDVPVMNRECSGDASETAVLRCMEQLVGRVDAFRLQHPKVCEIPFSSVNKYQVSIHKEPEGHLLAMKGAPEVILQRCSTVLLKDKTVETKTTKAHIEKVITDLAYMGERVLAFADLHLDPKAFPAGYHFDADGVNFPMTGLRLVGLVAMIDPPRLTVPGAIRKCRTAGIRVIMVTGDHPITGMSIAQKVGIITQEIDKKQPKFNLTDINSMSAIRFSKACVVTGAQLRNMPEAKLESILNNYAEIVFARTSPQQKLQIVEALQRLGEIVAVTGDGVNDSPALKKADIGIAMGITGTDVSKEAADMILLDDNFATIVKGIEEGRLIFDNLKKSISYSLTSNIPEVLPLIIFALLGVPEALNVMVIIAINVGTDLLPSISLAHEKAEADIMARMPRNQKEDKLVNARLIFMAYGQIGMIQACAVFATFFFVMATHGFFWDTLLHSRDRWLSRYTNDFEDNYGQEWTYEERMVLSKKCYAAFLVCVVITQTADLLICKTRTLSIFRQGMSNWVLNVGIIFSLALTAVIIYCPGVNTLFQVQPVEWYVLIPTVPFALLILIYDEARKFCIRRFPGGWVYRETYY